jgi:hypothetical protein
VELEGEACKIATCKARGGLRGRKKKGEPLNQRRRRGKGEGIRSGGEAYLTRGRGHFRKPTTRGRFGNLGRGGGCGMVSSRMSEWWGGKVKGIFTSLVLGGCQWPCGGGAWVVFRSCIVRAATR